MSRFKYQHREEALSGIIKADCLLLAVWLLLMPISGEKRVWVKLNVIEKRGGRDGESIAQGVS